LLVFQKKLYRKQENSENEKSLSIPDQPEPDGGPIHMAHKDHPSD
jgi:hypothetical protein